MDIFWQGKGGMRWHEMVRKVKQLLTIADSPTILIVHCGGNDMGLISPKTLREKIVRDLRVIQGLLPFTKIIWSQILPRALWKIDNSMDINRARLRVNSYVAKIVVNNLNGGYIKYPDISIDRTELFQSDNVHLSEIGSNILLNILSGGIESIIRGLQCVYPDMYM